MAFILKKSDTTKSSLIRYFIVTMGAAVLLNIFTVGFYFIHSKQYEKHIDQIFLLNQFYFCLDETNSILNQYMQQGIQTATLDSKAEELNSLTENLKMQNAGILFLRDIRDLREMAARYHEILQSVEEKRTRFSQDRMNVELLAQMNQEYSTAQEIYEIMSDDFKNLHLNLLESAKEDQLLFAEEEKNYFRSLLIALCFMMTSAVILGKQKIRRIVEPIQKLTETAENVLNGDIRNIKKTEIHEKMNREMRILVEAFYMMMEKIKTQIIQIEENASTKLALQEKEMENLKITNQLHNSQLKALQMQINPHFLFNTLSMISKTAYLGNSKTTVFLLQKTAKLLRYSLDYMGKAVTLACEIENLGNYVYLQEERFGERIDFDFDLDECFHELRVPCLILQPLVENAITHGVGSYLKDGVIKIQTCYKRREGLGEISVIDNGLGMAEEKKRQVEEELTSEKMQNEKIGLANVYMRLQIFYGGKAKMELFSTLGKGTEVKISIPYDLEEKRKEKEEKMDVSCINCG